MQFTGGGVFTSSTATTPAHSRGVSRCRVTNTAPGRRNPFHLVSEDGGRVHGWVMPVDVQAITLPAPSPMPERSPEEVTVDNAIAAGILTDRAHWLGVLTGNVKPVPRNIKRLIDNAIGIINGGR